MKLNGRIRSQWDFYKPEKEVLSILSRIKEQLGSWLGQVGWMPGWDN